MAQKVGVTGADAQRLYERIITVPVGGSVPYEELSAMVGRDVRREGRGSLCTARRQAHRLHSMVFLALRGVGLVNVTDEVKCRVGADFGPLRRLVRRKMRILGAVQDYGALPTAAQREHNMAFAGYGAIELMAKPTGLQRIARAVEVTQGVLPVPQTLALFLANGAKKGGKQES